MASCFQAEKKRQKKQFFVSEEEEEEEVILKKSISSHVLFGLLIQTHLNCLKVGLGELGEFGTTNTANDQPTFTPKPTIPPSSELDRFMEAYCNMLGKLKEAIEEPLQETTSFIDAMYIQLRDLRETHPINNSNPNSP
ncbi:protein KNATM-like [Pistacia vera]|uniref:protein KNATM-like n=1 Tax=Pistacia vera TaxID=55513 RepID=UPI001262C851|nr:protein KNATM-like [Pistacia vera]